MSNSANIAILTKSVHLGVANFSCIVYRNHGTYSKLIRTKPRKITYSNPL